MSVQVDITKRVVLIPMTMMVSRTSMSTTREASIPHTLMPNAVSMMLSRRKVKSVVEIVIFEAMWIMYAEDEIQEKVVVK